MGRPRWERIFSIAVLSIMAATTFISPLQNRQSVTSTLKTRFMSFAHDIRDLLFTLSKGESVGAVSFFLSPNTIFDLLFE